MILPEEEKSKSSLDKIIMQLSGGLIPIHWRIRLQMAVDRAGAWPAIANLINATTGWDFDYDDVDLIGERTHTIKKAFNIREGWTREDDHLPYRWQHEPMETGPSAGHVVTQEELEYLKDIYYKAKGWTKEGLIPKEKLVALGMDDVAEEIGV